MAVVSGLVVSVIVSLTAWPLVTYVTAHSVLSEPFPMMMIGFSLLLAIIVFMKAFLPPSSLKVKSKDLEGRGLLYYICCLFMWACVADFTIQSHHLELFGAEKNTRYFEQGELYLQTPLGITAQFWNAIFNYFMYLIIIYQIDNKIDCRNAAIYWSGNILASQFVVVIGALSGSFSNQLEYSVWMNVVFIFFPLWVFYHFLLKPRTCPVPLSSSSKYRFLDWILCVCLLAGSIFAFIRGLGALGSQMPIVKYYVDNYEPYILEASQFGKIWVLYPMIYGIPFQLAAIHGLLTPRCQWMISLSQFFAAGMLQGTFAYLVYSWYPSSEPKYRIPDDVLGTVLTVNIGLVVLSHVLMLRCMKEPEYFLCKEMKDKKG